jgi:hypothetical protein
VTVAFALGDTIHEEYREDSRKDDGVELSNMGITINEDLERQDNNDCFDPAILEKAIQELYEGSRSTTILLMNLYTVHKMSNNFVDELFIILHRDLLPDGNTLPRNHYAAKSLTSKLGLAYNSIHACRKGCVLFKGKYADAEWCPKCNESRFSNVDWTLEGNPLQNDTN